MKGKERKGIALYVYMEGDVGTCSLSPQRGHPVHLLANLALFFYVALTTA